jgi:predicted nucleotidyltransferase component of viral defense system
MHKEVLTPPATELFQSLKTFKSTFYLAGGTGLALQIGHRVSVDFDLFSETAMKKTFLQNVEALYPEKERKTLVSSSTELTMVIDGVKFTFLHYPFPVILPFNVTGPIPILAVKEILATKAYTIGRRGAFKDYIDIYSGLSGGHASLSEVITIAKQKYGDAFNDRLFLEQLVYLDDVESVEIKMSIDRVPSKEELIEYFLAKIRQESLL